MKYELVGQSAQDSDNVSANPSRLLNLYRERVQQGGRTGFVLKGVLGQEEKDSAGSAARAMGRGDGKNWMAAGGTLYEVASDGTLTSRGSITDDVETTIAGNYTDITAVSGNNYYIYDGSISQPTTKTFTNVFSHCYIGGYTVITETDGKRFQWSDLGDASTLDALNFSSAEQVDDNIVRPVEYRGNLLLFCQRSVETWQIVGTGTTAFGYVTVNNIGLKSHNLLARFDDALFFIGNDNVAYIYGQGSVSSSAVETSIVENDPTHCFYYEDEGHKFCVIRFSDRPAWCFDIKTGEWHERAEGAGFQPWRAIDSTRNGATWLVASTAGETLEMTRSSMDVAGVLHRRLIGYTVYNGDRFNVPKVELLFRAGDHALTDAQEFVLSLGGGLGLEIATGIGLTISTVAAGARDASVDLRESRDGGRTWSNAYSRSMGDTTDYEQRTTWRRRGRFRQYTPRWDINEAADITIYADGILEVTP